MADKKRDREDLQDFLQLRAKGQYLKIPKDIEKDYFDRPSGADHLSSHPKRKKKVLSRKGKRKNMRIEKKAKRSEFFQKNRKSGTIAKCQSGNSSSSKDCKSSKRNKTKKKKKVHPSARELERQRLNEENEKEDKEIKRLETLLNMRHKKKLPTQFMADGLDYILEVCDHDRFNITDESNASDAFGMQEGSTVSGKKKKANRKVDKSTTKINICEKSHLDVNDFQEQKSSMTDEEDDCDKAVDSVSDDEIGGYDSDCDYCSDFDSSHIDTGDDDESEKCLEIDKNSDRNKLTVITTKNPEIESSKDRNTGKYIPPHLRNKGTNDHLIRLKRELKGLLNKLSEGNLQFVCCKIEELFSKNSRNDMNDLLTQIILDSCVTSSLMPSKLLMEHCVLIAALNSNVGMEIGAYFTQALAEQFEKFHQDSYRNGDGKELLNIVSLFSHLYNFKVVHCGLIYDIIRFLSERFQETDIEQLLLILKSTGAEIRRDNPGTLKDIILELQAKAAAASNLSNDSRVRFMLEIITNIRNNNLRKIPGYDQSQVDHLRKVLRSVIRDTGSASSSQLQMSLKDLLQADTKGRWWIVGSAWTGRSENEIATTSSLPWSSQLLELARKQRMNTDVRRTVFCIIMTSEDYVDAFGKLLKLRLKDVQAREIIHVLLDCCLKEKSYNPFYAYLGQKFCEYNRSYQVTFQFSLWDKFKVIESLKQNSFHNLALLLGHLVASKALSLSVLKGVNFMDLERPSIRFFKHFFTLFLNEYPSDIVRKSFERISLIPDLSHLRQGMAIFIRHFILDKKDSNSDKICNLISLLQTRKESTVL